MIVSLIILLALLVVGGALYLHYRLTGGDNASAEEPEVAQQPVGDGECCGTHITCEKDSLVAGLDAKVVYYDDEELDAYVGREPEDYSDEEIEQFRDVLLTLLPEDIAGWARSIQLRGIQLPSAVRDELLMIVAEARQAKLLNGK